MRLEIHTADGGTLTIETFDADSLLPMLEELEAGHLLTFDVGGGMAYIPAGQVTRVDVFYGD